MRSQSWSAVVCLAILLRAVPSDAQEEQKVVLHGFGSWAYGQTDANATMACSIRGPSSCKSRSRGTRCSGSFTRR